MGVNLEVIEGGGCGPQVTASDSAAQYLDGLPPEVREALLDGIGHAIGNAFRLLMNMAMMPFSPRKDSIALAALSCDTVTFLVEDHALKFATSVGPNKLVFHLISLQQTANLSAYHKHSISSEIGH